MTAAPLGLIAGAGALPRLMARSARARGQRVVAVAYEGFADPGLRNEVDRIETLPVGQVEALVGWLRRQGVRRAGIAGRVPKEELFRDLSRLHLDDTAKALLAGLPDRRDHSILGALADLLAARGIELAPQGELAPELVARAGHLAGPAPGPGFEADLAFAWPIARQVAALQIGQTVVVKGACVLAVEAVEGTDAAIRRGGELGGDGAVVVKVARPGHDPRFDLPVVGPATLELLAARRASGLAVQAGSTLLLEQERWHPLAREAGISVVGVPAAGPPPAGGDPR